MPHRYSTQGIYIGTYKNEKCYLLPYHDFRKQTLFKNGYWSNNSQSQIRDLHCDRCSLKEPSRKESTLGEKPYQNNSNLSKSNLKK